MDRPNAKPGWNLTLWALAGFVLVALAVYMIDKPGNADVAATATQPAS